ncbi:hypothetical protein [Actinomadura fibrosa]|uniref:Uncharacterized protein n=1 Tax=Actinomadura fibrosa TaxID=111802 RepID=A0ABW2XXW1_9ACTN|nr:hypothetical protein [Actinomadura fibrosa]
MPDRLETRLAELRQDFAEGERRLRDLLGRETALRETLLRISGAIQMLEELIAEHSGPPSAGTPDSRPDTGAAAGMPGGTDTGDTPRFGVGVASRIGGGDASDPGNAAPAADGAAGSSGGDVLTVP